MPSSFSPSLASEGLTQVQRINRAAQAASATARDNQRALASVARAREGKLAGRELLANALAHSVRSPRAGDEGVALNPQVSVPRVPRGSGAPTSMDFGDEGLRAYVEKFLPGIRQIYTQSLNEPSG